MLSLANASVWTAISNLINFKAGLVVIKLLAIWGLSVVGQAEKFRQIITVLGVLFSTWIFNSVTKYVVEYH